MILIPLALVFVPGALMIEKFCRKQAFERIRKINWRIFYSVIIISLTLVSIYTQCWVLGERYLQESQLERHLDIMNNRASNPWQYRVLSEGGSFLFLKAGELIGLPSPVIPFVLFRVLQNIAIFWLIILFFRRLKMTHTEVILGLVMICWGMSYAFFNSDLHFSTYSDIIFYLIALLLILARRDWWILLIAFLAALNRESAAILPLILPAMRLKTRGWKPYLPRSAIIIFLLSSIIFFLVFFGLRFGLGWRSFTGSWGQPSFLRLWRNLNKGLGWHNFFLTVNILPLVCIFTFKFWPTTLKRIFLSIIPLWLIIHYYTKGCIEETRFLLLPLIIVFVPGTMILLRMGKNSRETADKIQKRTADSLPQTFNLN